MKFPRSLALLLLAAATLAGAAPSPLAISVKNLRGGPVTDAVISLGPLDGAVPPAADASVAIGQQNQEFTPYVAVVQAGTRVLFPNKDTVQHHGYSLSKAK